MTPLKDPSATATLATQNSDRSEPPPRSALCTLRPPDTRGLRPRFPQKTSQTAPRTRPFPCSCHRPSYAGRGGRLPSRLSQSCRQRGKEGEPGLVSQVQGPVAFPAVPVRTLATHQDSQGHLHQPTTPRPVSKAKRSWTLFGEVCFLEECSIAGRFWGLGRKTDSNALMSSRRDRETPPPPPGSSPAAPSAYRSLVSPRGTGLAPASLRPTGLSSHLLETHLLLRQATKGSVTLAHARPPPPDKSHQSLWHHLLLGTCNK